MKRKWSNIFILDVIKFLYSTTNCFNLNVLFALVRYDNYLSYVNIILKLRLLVNQLELGGFKNFI